MRLSAIALIFVTAFCMETAPAQEQPLSLFDFGDFDQIFFPQCSPTALILLSMTSEPFKKFVQKWYKEHRMLLPICEEYIYESSHMPEYLKCYLNKNFENVLNSMTVPHDPYVGAFKRTIMHPWRKADTKLIAQLVDYPELVDVLLRLKQFKEPLAPEHILAQPEGNRNADLVVSRLGQFSTYEQAFQFIMKHTMIKPSHFSSLYEKLPEDYIEQLDETDQRPSYSTAVLLRDGALESTASELKHDCFSLAIALRLVNDMKSSALMLAMLHAYKNKPRSAQLFLQSLKFGLYEPLIREAVKVFLVCLDKDANVLEDFKVKMIKAIVQYDLDRGLYNILRGEEISRLTGRDRQTFNNKECLLLVESALVMSPTNEELLRELCQDVKLNPEVFVLFVMANVSHEVLAFVADTCLEEPVDLRNALRLASYDFNYMDMIEFVDLTRMSFESTQILVKNSLESYLVDNGHRFFSDLVYSQIVVQELTSTGKELRTKVEAIIETLYRYRPAPLTMLALLKILFKNDLDYGFFQHDWLSGALSKRWACELFSSMSLEELAKIEKLSAEKHSILISTGKEIYQAKKFKEA